MIKLEKKSLRKLAKLTIFFRMKREKQTTISLVTQLLKELVEAAKVLVDLILHLSQIFLRTFLAILVEEAPQEDLVTEEMILDTM